MKLCFSTLGCTELTLGEIIELAHKHNINALEFRGIDGELDNRNIDAFKKENISKTLPALRNGGIIPVVLGTSCCFHSPDRFDAAINEGVSSIDIASSLDIPYIRVFGNDIIGDREECLKRIANGINTLCEYAKGKNVMVLLEVHGDLNTVESILSVVKLIAVPEHFGLLWDVCHTHQIYSEKWFEFYNSVKSYIRHVHIKDMDSKTAKLTQLGYGDIPLAEIIRELVSDGYEGYFSLEWEKRWHPELPELDEALSHFRELALEVQHF